MSKASKINFIGSQYASGFEVCTPSNDAADEIIRSPDLHLLNKDQLFTAEGGWNNIALTVGLSAIFAFSVFGYRPRTFTHFKHGQMNFREWAWFGGALYGGAVLGQHAGVYLFGDW